MSESITEIPPKEVGRVVQDFVDDGAEQIVVERDAAGTYTVSRSAVA